MIENYDLIIWDWNGTLLDDSSYCLAITNSMLEKRGLPLLPKERYQEIMDFPIIDYYAKLGFDYEKEPYDLLAHEFIDEYENGKGCLKLRTGVKETLNKIKELGKSQAILSAYVQNALRSTVASHGIQDSFDQIVGMDNVYAHGKIDLAKKFINAIGNHKSKILYIGDTTHDYEVAQEMGVDSILVFSGHNSIERLKNCKVNVITELGELFNG
jgi:phosphoglycolate phosphatase